MSAGFLRRNFSIENDTCFSDSKLTLKVRPLMVVRAINQAALRKARLSRLRLIFLSVLWCFSVFLKLKKKNNDFKWTKSGPNTPEMAQKGRKSDLVTTKLIKIRYFY